MEDHYILVDEGESDLCRVSTARVREGIRDVSVIALAYGCSQSIAPWVPLLAGLRVIVALDNDANGVLDDEEIYGNYL